MSQNDTKWPKVTLWIWFFNKTTLHQLHTANRVIQGIRSLQGYDYPKRFSIIDKDPAKTEGDRFCFLFSNQTDDNYTGDTETGVTDTQVTDTQVTDTQTVVDTQNSFSVHDSKNSRVLASTDEDENLSINELMQRLQKNLEKNYPSFWKWIKWRGFYCEKLRMIYTMVMLGIFEVEIERNRLL